jgi:hypothetical protein
VRRHGTRRSGARRSGRREEALFFIVKRRIAGLSACKDDVALPEGVA